MRLCPCSWWILLQFYRIEWIQSDHILWMRVMIGASLTTWAIRCERHYYVIVTLTHLEWMDDTEFFMNQPLTISRPLLLSLLQMFKQWVSYLFVWHSLLRLLKIEMITSLMPPQSESKWTRNIQVNYSTWSLLKNGSSVGYDTLYCSFALTKPCTFSYWQFQVQYNSPLHFEGHHWWVLLCRNSELTSLSWWYHTQLTTRYKVQNVPSRCREICFPNFWTNELYMHGTFPWFDALQSHQFRFSSLHVGKWSIKDVRSLQRNMEWFMIFISKKYFEKACVAMLASPRAHFNRDGCSWLQFLWKQCSSCQNEIPFKHENNSLKKQIYWTLLNI